MYLIVFFLKKIHSVLAVFFETVTIRSYGLINRNCVHYVYKSGPSCALNLRRRWVDIGMDLGEVGWGQVDWIGLAQDRNR
jgi:hypothetical protein